MTRYQAHRERPCQCATCRADRIVADIGRGILYGFAAVGVVVFGWAVVTIILSARPW